MIEVEHLTKRYGTTVAVDDLSFGVPAGRVTGFLGPNGAGKSTTMRMILGLDAPTSGRATVGGRSYRDLPAPLCEVGALLDAKAMHGGRSAANHLRVLAASNGLPASRVREVLAMVGLETVGRRRTKGFSLGMGQRLGIAAAMLGDPGVLLFDEPVNGLDPEGIVWVRTMMKSLAAEGRTVLVSSHLMNEMAVTADYLIVIGRGRLISEGTVADFIARSSHRSVIVRTPDLDRMARLVTDAGGQVRPTPERPGIEVRGLDSAAIGGLAAAHGVVLHELTPQQASLEEAFMELTAGSVEYAATGGGAVVTQTQVAAPGRLDPAPASRTGRVRRATFADALRAETTKLFTVRSTWVTLLVATLLSIGIGLAVSAVAASNYSTMSLSDRLTWDPTSISLSGFALGQLAISILGILFVTSEYSTGMIRSTLAAVPRRGRVLAAKLTVFTVVAVGLGEILAFASFLVGQLLIEGSAPSAGLGGHDVARAVVATGLYLGVLSVIGMGIGTLVRSTAASIAAVVALLFVLPGVALALPTSLRRDVEKFWPTQAGQQVTNVVRGTHVLSPWAGFADMCVFAAILVVLAAGVLGRRDA